MSAWRATSMAVLGSVALLLLGGTSVLANGSKSKRVRYSAEVQTGDTAAKRCRFDAEVEPLLFRLSTVRDKYRVVRIRIQNAGDRRLVLSLADDRMELQLQAGTRPAVLDLGTHDPGLWDSLSPELRGGIAYPRGVDPGEEESVFVFIPVAEAVSAPQAFRYTISSLAAEPVIIRDATPAVRH